MNNIKNIYDHRELALTYHRRMPERIRTYLLTIGISSSIICRYRLGWDGNRITIPITDRERRVTYFRFVQDPDSNASTDEVLDWPDADLELYGWERVMSRREGVVICGGEIDRLILESHGIAAISLPRGLEAIPEAWIPLLCQMPIIYVCLPSSETVPVSLEMLTAAFPHARLIRNEGLGADGVSGFFVKERKTLEDFTALCEQAFRLDGQSITNDGDA